MIQYGFGARCFGGHKIKYTDEVELAKNNGFDFVQIWYDAEQEIEITPHEGQEKIIKESNFPSIIHAVLDISEIEEHTKKLIPILKYLGHRELIIHPKDKNNVGIDGLKQVVKSAFDELSKNRITLYLENNSKLTPIFSSAKEIEYIFAEIPELELLLDIAHVDSLDILKEIVAIKYPKILHIADRHLEVVHEHLPIGKGNIDFKCILKDILQDFEGKIIFEIVESTESLINSKNYISGLVE